MRPIAASKTKIQSPSSSEREGEDIEEHCNDPTTDDNVEEIGDVDPQAIAAINQQFAEDMLKAEADTFWCLSKLIDDIQDNFTEMQPGVHKIINKMKALI